jgi:hypothetical protein
MPLSNAERARRWRANRAKSLIALSDPPKTGKLRFTNPGEWRRQREEWVKGRAAVDRDWSLKPHVCSRVGLPAMVQQWLDLRHVAQMYGPGPVGSWWHCIGLRAPRG